MEVGYVDPLLAALTVALMAFGVVMVYSASAIEATVKLDDPEFYLRRQAAFAGISLVVMFFVSRIDTRKLRLLTYPIFISTLLLLGLSLTGFGHSGGGATRWLQIAGVRIQPAEMAKLALILWLGYSLAKKADRVKTFSIGMIPHLAVLAVVMLMCLGQPDFGSAVVMAVITIVMLFVAGATSSPSSYSPFLAPPTPFRARRTGWVVSTLGKTSSRIVTAARISPSSL